MGPAILACIFLLFMASLIGQKTLAMSVAPGVTLSSPEIRAPSSSQYAPTYGAQRMITTTLNSMYDSDLQFVVFIEVRDSNGVTIFLQYHASTLKGPGHTELGSSWLAPDNGTYEIRVFAISNFTRPEVLTSVATNTVIISV
jgi:hypothetical protein